MKTTVKKRTMLPVCATLAAGFLAYAGCVTEETSQDRFSGERVEIPVCETAKQPAVKAAAKPVKPAPKTAGKPEKQAKVKAVNSARDLTLSVTTSPTTSNVTLTKSLALAAGVKVQEQLRSRGYRVLAAGGKAVKLNFSLQEYRPYKDEKLDWRTYIATADIEVPAEKGAVARNTFVVDGRTLEGKLYYIQESAALAPVQNELLKQIETWLASVLKDAPKAK